MTIRQDNSGDGYKSGEELLAAWKLSTREQRLEQAVKVLLQTIEELHVQANEQSLKENLYNVEIYCSCADAYRIGTAALHLGWTIMPGPAPEGNKI